MPTATHRPNAGFTLTELLITLLVLGVLSSIAIASFGGSRRSASESNAIVTISNALNSLAPLRSAGTWHATRYKDGDGAFAGGYKQAEADAAAAAEAATPLSIADVRRYYPNARPALGSQLPGNGADDGAIFVTSSGSVASICAASKGSHSYCTRYDLIAKKELHKTGGSTDTLQSLATTDTGWDGWKR